VLIVQDILISDDIIEEQFMCNLNACKGACCWEGDFGAPLEKAELETLDHIYPDVKPFLSPAGIQAIEKQGTYTYTKEANEYSTPLIDNGPCAYMTYDKNGVAQCGIEQAHNAGKVDFKKPISCHLYPIRVTSSADSGFQALNYDRWDICSAACELGKSQQMPVFRFVKDALIRKYGEAFYEELEAAASYLDH
jgi:hypothetical protein